MPSQVPAVTQESLGAWLIKGSRHVYPVDELVKTGFSTVTAWSLRPTYRTDLIKPGQRVLFWISGNDPANPAGIYAQGLTSGRAMVDVADDEWVEPAARGTRKLFMPVELWPLDAPILRDEIVNHPVLSNIEVIRMAAGSNPSFVDKDQLSAMQLQWPELTFT